MVKDGSFEWSNHWRYCRVYEKTTRVAFLPRKTTIRTKPRKEIKTIVISATVKEPHPNHLQQLATHTYRWFLGVYYFVVVDYYCTVLFDKSSPCLGHGPTSHNKTCTDGYSQSNETTLRSLPEEPSPSGGASTLITGLGALESVLSPAG